MPTQGRRFWPILLIVLLAVPGASAQVPYQILLKGGHVIDPRNQVDAVMDVAVADGKIAAVRPDINPAEAQTVVDVSGLYVTPGLIDAHVHVFATTGMRGAWAGDNSVLPDEFSFRTGVTERLRPGDISTHMFRGPVPYVDATGRLLDYLKEAVPAACCSTWVTGEAASCSPSGAAAGWAAVC